MGLLINGNSRQFMGMLATVLGLFDRKENDAMILPFGCSALRRPEVFFGWWSRGPRGSRRKTSLWSKRLNDSDGLVFVSQRTICDNPRAALSSSLLERPALRYDILVLRRSFGIRPVGGESATAHSR
jgi:hypothetical protein